MTFYNYYNYQNYFDEMSRNVKNLKFNNASFYSINLKYCILIVFTLIKLKQIISYHKK